MAVQEEQLRLVVKGNGYVRLRGNNGNYYLAEFLDMGFTGGKMIVIAEDTYDELVKDQASLRLLRLSEVKVI
jgi:hypothetical protein